MYTMRIENSSFKRWLEVGFFLSLFFYIMGCTIVEDEDSLPEFALTLSETVLQVGESNRIDISNSFYYGDRSDDISWTSDNINIATVTNGVVTAIAPGTAKITASFHGITNTTPIIATAIIKVPPPVPTNLTNSTGNLSSCAIPFVDLTWEPSTSATFYKLYRDDEEITENIITNSYRDTGLDGSNTYKVRACSDAGCSSNSKSTTVNMGNNTNKGNNFENIINKLNKIPANLTNYDPMSREIFSLYNSGASIVAIYLNVGESLKAVLDGITDAAENKVYVVLLSEGTYTVTNMSMKNHVAIVGYVSKCQEESSQPIVLDGGNEHRVFKNNKISSSALLYGVTIANGNDEKGGGMYNQNSSPTLTKVVFSHNNADKGGGMYNQNSSPTLTGVVFSNNNAKDGGGMYNQNSSPELNTVNFFGNEANTYFSERGNGGGMYNNNNSKPDLTQVAFSGNTADDDGGGMYNDNSKPELEEITFSNNTANSSGGGMYNKGSSPALAKITFSGNTARYGDGGGMYNEGSSPLLAQVTFSRNTAKESGGGMYNSSSSPTLIGVTFFSNQVINGHGMSMGNNNDGENGPLILNSIFWGEDESSSSEIYFYKNGTQQENLHIYNSIVKGGTGNLVSGNEIKSTGDIYKGGFIANGGRAPVVISFSSIIADDPGLKPLANNGGWVWTHAIPSDSPAVNQGLYVKKVNDIYYYYSTNNTTWYANPDLSYNTDVHRGGVAIPSGSDATGFTRTDRPDIGAYEYRKNP